MGTNGMDIATAPRFEEEMLRVQSADHSRALGSLDRTHAKRVPDNRPPDPESGDAADDFALAPLVDKIAYGIARGLIVAVKELELHIAGETRKVGDAVDRRMEVLQASLQDLSKFMAEQQSTNGAVQGQIQQLAIELRETGSRHEADVQTLRSEARDVSETLSRRIEASASSLQEADARQVSGLEALQSETRLLAQTVSERIDGLSSELSVQQEDISALKTTLSAFSSRVEALMERLDRQADAVRSMYTAYSQRETELEQLVDGLARLRAQPTPLPFSAL